MLGKWDGATSCSLCLEIFHIYNSLVKQGHSCWSLINPLTGWTKSSFFHVKQAKIATFRAIGIFKHNLVSRGQQNNFLPIKKGVRRGGQKGSQKGMGGFDWLSEVILSKKTFIYRESKARVKILVFLAQIFHFLLENFTKNACGGIGNQKPSKLW